MNFGFSIMIFSYNYNHSTRKIFIPAKVYIRIVFYDRGERFAVVAYGYIHGRLMGDLIGQRGTFGNSPHRQETDNWNSVKGD